MLKCYPFSIVMPVYNRPEFIPEAIESVLAQNYPDFELLIVDDGSTDPQVHQILAKYKKQPRIRIYRKHHGGPGSAINFAAARARFEHLCRLDSDDKLQSFALGTVNRYINASPGVSYFYSSRHVIDEYSQIVIGDKLATDGIYKSCVFDRLKLNEENICNHFICWNKRDFLAVGGMCEDMFWAEDWDLALRMAMHFDFQNIDEALYFVREYDGPRLTCAMNDAEKNAVVRDMRRRLHRNPPVPV
jgi:glycosyltransferase involved in cell wall biosynthesis